jgi:hypothetical protein
VSDYEALTGYGQNPVGSRNYSIAQEKLKALGDKTSKQLLDWQRKYMRDPSSLGDPYAYTKPSSTAKKLTDQQLQEAEKKMQPPVSQSQPAPSSKVNRGALPAGAPSIFDTGTGKDTGMRARGRGGR